MTILDDVQVLVERNCPDALCDDCIAEQLDLSVRQHANHKTRELEKSPEFRRERGYCISCGKTKTVIGYIGSIKSITHGFDWDKHMSQKPYNQVLNGIQRLKIPTMYSPDKTQVFLASQDVAIGAKNYDEIRRMRDHIKQVMVQKCGDMKGNISFGAIEKVYRLQIDYFLLEQLLSENPNYTGEYYPEKIFTEINK